VPDTYGPIRATTLRQQVFQVIRTEILAGRLKPGEKILEAELAAHLGLSRNPVREAIARLEQVGLVTSIANRGTYVVQLSREQAHDLLRLRAHLELLAVRLALQDHRPGQFDGLAPIVEKMLDLFKRPMEADELHGQMNLLDSEFHGHLVACSKSEALCRAWDCVAPCDLIFVQEYAIRAHGDARHQLEQTAQNHVQLLEALRSGNPAAALAAIRGHFSLSSLDVVGKLDAQDFRLLAWEPD
jgi:DNA-binding GntR family transcriptional regulator